jgi:diacylglycerol kinase family enzyme
MIGLILNPNALGVQRQSGLRERLAAILGRHGEIRETRTPEELADAVRHFAAHNAAIIATCGGDGTNLATITEVVRTYPTGKLPVFALLRGGTVNTVAQNLRIHGRPDEILTRLCERRARGDEVPEVAQDLLEVNGLYGFLFAAAMGARFLEAYYGGVRPGNTWAAALAARTVASSLVSGRFARWLFAPVDLELEVDGRISPMGPPRLLLASTVPDVGIGMKVTWQAGQQPGRFHLVASRLSTTRMALQLHKVLLGRPLDGAPHLDVLAQRARIRFASPQTYTLDGDLFRETDVEIGVGPRLWIARP